MLDTRGLKMKNKITRLKCNNSMNLKDVIIASQHFIYAGFKSLNLIFKYTDLHLKCFKMQHNFRPRCLSVLKSICL